MQIQLGGESLKMMASVANRNGYVAPLHCQCYWILHVSKDSFEVDVDNNQKKKPLTFTSFSGEQLEVYVAK